MKRPSPRRFLPAFTLIEMLVVIAIIAVLAGLLLPVLATAKKKGKIVQAQTEVRNIAAAISAYQSTYGIYPAPTQDAKDALDRTYTNDNAAIIIILLDEDRVPNENHRRNPQKHVFLNAKMSGGDTGPGVGTDFVFRDPWGKPYCITLDLAGDNKCDDHYYSYPNRYPNPPIVPLPAPVVVWSMGEDGVPNVGSQKDDIRSW
ncbi:MAG: type II secretion system protein [Verrucomicrobia bacterium]|nr:type II secretion system protein [Verrucomicrobiota bacterium]